MPKKKVRVKAKPKPGKKRKVGKPAKAKAKTKAEKSPPVKISASKAAKKKKGKPAKKPGAVPASVRPRVIAPVNGVFLGLVEDFFAKIGVIALTLKSTVSVGQRVQILGYTTHLEQVVESMQIDHVPVTQAAAGEGVGIHVIGRARAGDHVYLLK